MVEILPLALLELYKSFRDLENLKNKNPLNENVCFGEWRAPKIINFGTEAGWKARKIPCEAKMLFRRGFGAHFVPKIRLGVGGKAVSLVRGMDESIHGGDGG